ncbi:tape measure protein [Histophilus somni]|uniref:tape measure protein n=1 Tax=Histophilus somni TaxID=731 RepID=UPI00201F59B6|nr:tape measure protein [Histophilus somni]
MTDFSLNVQFEAFENIAKVFSGIKEKTAKVTKAFEDVHQTLGSTEQAFNALQSEDKQLSSQLGQVQGVMKQEQALSQLANQMQEARAKSRELKIQLKNAKAEGQSEKAIAKLANAYEKAKQSSQNLFDKHRVMNGKLGEQKQKLQQAGINTKNLAQTEANLKNRIDQTNNSLNQQANRLEQATKRTEKLAQAREKFNKGLERAANLSLTGQNMFNMGKGVMGSMANMGQKLMGFVDTASTFEGFRATLETIEGSSEKANKSLDWVSEFAAKTPYELDNVMSSFVKLKSYGLDPTNGLLKTLGDTASAMGKELDQAVEAIADAVTGQNERLKEFGITSETKGNKITYTYVHDGKQMKKSVNKNDKKKIEQTLSSIFNQKYAGSMEKQSKTFSGMVSNLMDTWTRFQTMVMSSGAFDAIKNKLSGVLDTLDKMSQNGELQSWAEDVGKSLLDLFESAWEVGKGIFSAIKSVAEFARENKTLVVWLIKLTAVLASASMILGTFFNIFSGITAIVNAASFLTGLASSSTLLVGVITALKTAFIGFFTVLKVGFATMLANPAFLAFIAIVAVIAGAAYLIWKNWDWLKAKLINAWQAVSDFFHNLWGNVKKFGIQAFDALCEMIANINFLSALKKALSGALDWAKNAISGLFGGSDEPTMQTAGVPSNGLGSPGGLFQGGVNQPRVVKNKPITNKGKNAMTQNNTHISVNVAKTDADPQQIARAVNQAMQQQQAAQESRQRRRLVD